MIPFPNRSTTSYLHFSTASTKPGATGHNKKYKPIVHVPTADQHQQIKALQKEIATLQQQPEEGNEGTTTGVVSSQERLQAVRKSLKDLQKSVPYQLVSVELPEVRPAHLLVGGDFLQPADEVFRDVPVVFPPLGEDQPCDRLGLARWLVSPQHPAYGQSHREPLLGPAVWPRAGVDARGFWQGRRRTNPSETAGLVGVQIQSVRLEHQAATAAVGVLSHLPAIVPERESARRH